MSKIFIEDTTLVAIGNAIREKTGSSDKLNPLDMPTAIGGIETGGGGGVTEYNATKYASTVSFSHPTSNDTYKEYMDGKSFTINLEGDSDGLLNSLFAKNTTTEDLSGVVVNVNCSSVYYAANMFTGCTELKKLPVLNVPDNAPKGLINFFQMFQDCFNLTHIDTNFWNNIIKLFPESKEGGSWNIRALFNNCRSLRQAPDLTVFSDVINDATNASYYLYQNLFQNNYVLDTAENIAVMNSASARTSNMFSGTFYECYRLKDITFDTDNGIPYVRDWSSQTIDLTGYIGYGSSNLKYMMKQYNSSITEDKEVTDDATYQALKDDPDWFTIDVAYSRYNHDSAVKTINSLPDCSSGTNNVIKFKGESGSATDGGAINTLTEEEIAVAATKGWTVSFA